MNNKVSRIEYEESIESINPKSEYLLLRRRLGDNTKLTNYNIKENHKELFMGSAQEEAILISKKVNDIMKSDSTITAQEASDYIVFNEIITSTPLDVQIINNCVNAQKRLKELFKKYNIYSENHANNIDYIVSEAFFNKIHRGDENIGKTGYSNENEYMFVEEEPLPNGLSFLSYRPVGDFFEVELIELGKIESGYGEDFDNEVEVFTRLNEFAKKLKNAGFNVKAWIDSEHLSIRFDGQKMRINELEKLFELSEEFKKGSEEE